MPFTSINVRHSLRKVEISCSPNSFRVIDWLSIQNADMAVPPPGDMVLEWHDIRAPAGGYTEPVIADDGWDWLYMGSDVAGFARRDVTGSGTWETANGIGMNSLSMGGSMSLVDVLPISDVSGEVYALMGDVTDAELAGGLWYTTDNGNNWEMLASSWDNVAFTTGIDENLTENDIGGYRLETNCYSAAKPANRAWEYGGGRHIQGNSQTPESGDTIFIANNDYDARGVSIWDGTEACALPNAGTALPAEPVGAILRLDVEPNGTPILLVGYRGRLANAAGLFVCELPAAGVDCSGTSAEANCWEVADPLWGIVELYGVDVRDFQVDHYAADLGDTAILVADGGNRPDDTNSDGLGENCDHVEAKLSELFLNDNSGFGVVSFEDYDTVTDSLAMFTATTDYALTGVSMDPLGSTVVINMPASRGAQYAIDRAYRAPAADVYALTADWEPVNTGENPVPAIDQLDAYESHRQYTDSDYGGTWLETSVGGLPAPFPARLSPGSAFDTYFTSWTFANGSWGDIGVMSGGYNAWLVQGITSAWTDVVWDAGTDVDPEGDLAFTFWPDIDEGEQSYQSTVVEDVAIDAQGHIWAPARDLGLLHFASFEPFDPNAPEGAENDCLFDGWGASANSVSVATDGSVWITLLDQTVNSGDYYPHNIGVLRTEDQGETWQYAAAGWQEGSALVMNVDDTVDYGERLCADNDDTLDRVMPFDATTGTFSPAHAFSVDDPLATGEEVLVTNASLGTTEIVRAVDRNLAVALFKPTSVVSGGTTYTTDGGFYYTADAGGTWNKVDFDGVNGETTDCDEQQSYKTAYFELVHPGVDNYWIGDQENEMLEFRLDFVVSFAHGSTWETYSDDVVEVTSGDKRSHCSLARVTVDPTGTSWTWIPLTWTQEVDYNEDRCGVFARNITKLSVAPESDEIYIWGNYLRDFNITTGAQGSRYGGVCSVDLATAATKMIVNPAEREVNIGAVAPHPEVADLLAIMPAMDTLTWLQCYQLKDASATPPQVRCPDAPWPMLSQRIGPDWNLKVLDTMPPVACPSHAQWSNQGIPDDRDDGDEIGSWLAVGQYCAGAWRGEMTW